MTNSEHELEFTFAKNLEKSPIRLNYYLLIVSRSFVYFSCGVQLAYKNCQNGEFLMGGLVLTLYI